MHGHSSNSIFTSTETSIAQACQRWVGRLITTFVPLKLCYKFCMPAFANMKRLPHTLCLLDRGMVWVET